MQKKAKNILNKLGNLDLDAEDKLFFRRFGSLMSTIRRNPITQARLMHGVFLPIHERVMLRPTRWSKYDEYHFVGGRGSAKSFTVASMCPVLYAEVYGRKKIATLSASRFRGGKVIMEEAERLVRGTLDSQREPAPFADNMIDWRKIVKRETDRWYIPFNTDTTVTTIPTGNEETARGLRANLLFLDEADNWEKETIDKVFGPYLAVESNFAAPARTSSSNKIFFTGTVSYSHKDWAKALKDREEVIRKKYEIHQALEKDKDFDKWNRLKKKYGERTKHASFMLQRWDYKDLIIPTKLENHEVYYPSISRSTNTVEVNSGDIIEYDPRDEQDYIYTYPVNKEYAESQLDDGLTDRDLWAAEWRCQIIESSGNVYPHDLIDAATGTELVKVSDAKKAGWDVQEYGPYVPPLLYRCDDPCVLGVDPARTSDFCGFVVIRIGELAKGDYDVKTGTGNTPWNNVIWAEQKRNMTIKEIAAKIRHFKERYNLVVPDNPTKAPGITIDARGAMAGTTVRDELANPSPEVDEQGNVDPRWKKPQPIYDPEDKEYTDLRSDQNAWPGLRLLWTSDKMNTELVSYSKGQLEASKLYIADYKSKNERPDGDPIYHAGYVGVDSLAHQLRSIQGVPTKYAFRYEMPGDERRLDMKKDLFSAFLYACTALRDHQRTSVKPKKKGPVTAAIAVRPNRGRHNLFGDDMKRF